MKFFSCWAGFFAGVVLAGLGWSGPGIAAGDVPRVPVQAARHWDFGGVHFDNDFSGARLNGCEPAGAHEFTLTISPENKPINPSPWFAFHVSADERQALTLHLDYTYDGPHGRPWWSEDGKKWSRVDPGAYVRGPQTNRASLRLMVGKGPVWVAAWDMVGLREIGDWTDQLCRKPFVTEGSAGFSMEHRPLREVIVGGTTNANYVFVIGRQHPPEITGSLGLMSFVDTVAGDTRLARRFRLQFQTVVVPVVNPDGLEHGHWRSNLGGVDLNRDWMAFSQPETVAVRDFILRHAAAPGARTALFVDFHSTGTNIFYSVPPGKGDTSPDFTDRWLAALRRDCPGFGFERDDAHNAGEATSKGWAQAALHAPAITCEFGYGTDRELVRRAARIEAEDMMELLLSDREKAARGE